MTKRPVSKFFLGSMSAPLLLAMAASVFFSATPGLLFAGPLNGRGQFISRIDPTDPSTRVVVRLHTADPNVILIRYGSGAGSGKFFLRPGTTSTVTTVGTLDAATYAIIERCFPAGGGPLGAPFTAAEVVDLQAFWAMF